MVAQEEAAAAATTTTATTGISRLPDEILLLTLTYIPPASVLSLSRVSRRFYTLTASPELWKHYCQTGFAFWDSRHAYESTLRNRAFADWKALFLRRHSSSVSASSALNAIIRSESRRFDHIRRILSVGYDAKDVLLDAYEQAEGQDYHLAQRYWSHVALGCLNRQIAVEQWIRLDALGDDDAPNGTELSFAALDMFVLGERRAGDVNDILARLDLYADSVRAEHPNIESGTATERAVTIAQHLLDKDWVGISDGRDYHSLDHMFLGVSLFSTNHNSVPLISTIVFCYVCRRLGLDAQPISYPFHVHALIKSPPGLDLDGRPLPADFDQTSAEPSALTHLYMDPFASSEPVPIAHLLSRLAFIMPGSNRDQMIKYLTPASRRELIIRAAHNILASPPSYQHPPLFPIAIHSASYAAWFSVAIMESSMVSPQRGNVRQHLANLAQHFFEFFEQDIDLFETHILPLTRPLEDAEAFRYSIRQLRASDSTVPRPKRRAPRPSHGQDESCDDGDDDDDDDDPTWRDNSLVKYRVGQVFRHRRRAYLAVIYGWDPFCKMQEAWIRMNGVDRLSMGRRQPFYHVLVQDESLRYVAEENIELLQRDEMHEPMWQEFPIQLGKWFKRWDAERGVFVSNVTAEYPDD